MNLLLLLLAGGAGLYLYKNPGALDTILGKTAAGSGPAALMSDARIPDAAGLAPQVQTQTYTHEVSVSPPPGSTSSAPVTQQIQQTVVTSGGPIYDPGHPMPGTIFASQEDLMRAQGNYVPNPPSASATADGRELTREHGGDYNEVLRQLAAGNFIAHFGDLKMGIRDWNYYRVRSGAQGVVSDVVAGPLWDRPVNQEIYLSVLGGAYTGNQAFEGHWA